MKRLIFASCLCILFASTVALGDWDEGDFAKWKQLPDTTPAGIDVWNTGVDKDIADDFECISTDPILDVHIWGSWLNDEHEASVNRIWLYIYDDDPVGPEGPDPDNNFSKPGTLRWTGQFSPSGADMDGYFTEREYSYLINGGEMFWDPNQGEQLGTDGIIYQYNIYINPEDAFVQEGEGAAAPRIYWLAAEVFPEWEDEEYGWKTRDPDDGHFMDNAVYWDSVANDWAPLVYPDGHIYEGLSIDMAFVITPEPTTIALLGLGGLSLIRRKRSA